MFTKKESQSVLRMIFNGWVIVTSVIGNLLVALVLLILAVVTSTPETNASHSLSETVLREGNDDIIAVVDVSGVIVDSDGSSDPFALDSGQASARDIGLMLDQLANDDAIDGVILRINSPGGAVVASDELYHSIEDLSSKKVVVAQFNDVAASGGYYIAMGADKVVANPASITGSIGVIVQFPELTELYQKIGVDVRTFKSGEYKDIGAANRAFTDEEEEIINALVDDGYQQFVDAIVKGRNMSREDVLELADGRIYSGQQAYDNKLVDELGGFDTAVMVAEDLANTDGATLIEYSDDSFFDALFSSAQRQVFPQAQLFELIPPTKFGAYYLLTY